MLWWSLSLSVTFCLNLPQHTVHMAVMVAINELLCLKNAGAQISMFFISNE